MGGDRSPSQAVPHMHLPSIHLLSPLSLLPGAMWLSLGHTGIFLFPTSLVSKDKATPWVGKGWYISSSYFTMAEASFILGPQEQTHLTT